MQHAIRVPAPGPKSDTDDLDQEVLACGRNDTGQLGTGDTVEHILYRVAISALNRCRILLLATGTHHTFALTTHERTPIFGWGWGKYGQLGTSSTANCLQPTPINLTHQLEGASVVDISAGYGHSALVTSNGKLFTTGRNDMGQLGLGHTMDKSEFTHAKLVNNVVKVAAGEYFCIALERCAKTGSENIWSFGSNEFGQLGVGDFINRSRPQMVKLDKLCGPVRVHQLKTGPFHCVVSLTNFEIYSWGRGDCGQTGLGFRKSVNIPLPMTRLMELVGEQPLRLLAVRAHNIAVTAHTGEIVVWGRNNRAQLGLTRSAVTDPDDIALLDPFSGSDFTDLSSPKLNILLSTHGVQGSEISDIAAGPFHTSVILNGGQLRMWGGITEQGMPNTSPHTEPEDDPVSLDHVPRPISLLNGRTITHIGVGYSHMIFVLEPQLPLIKSTFPHDLGATLDDPTFSDISLIVQDRVIHAHRIILAARSKFFRAMFASGMLETKQKEVIIRDVQYDAFYGLLLYLYTDSFHRGTADSNTPQLALDVLHLAELYDLPRLIQLCEASFIESNSINIDNVVELYEMACRLHAGLLKNRCYWFISKHFEQVSTTDAWLTKLPQELKSHFSAVALLFQTNIVPDYNSASSPP